MIFRIVLVAPLVILLVLVSMPGVAGASPGAGTAVSPLAARFFSSIQDMPLMPGLTELPGQGVTFDKPEGRIIEAVALTGDSSRESVRSYYDSVLPQFGWSRLDVDRYARGPERLSLGFETHDGRQFLRIMLTPGDGAGP